MISKKLGQVLVKHQQFEAWHCEKLTHETVAPQNKIKSFVVRQNRLIIEKLVLGYHVR